MTKSTLLTIGMVVNVETPLGKRLFRDDPVKDSMEPTSMEYPSTDPDVWPAPTVAEHGSSNRYVEQFVKSLQV